MTTWSGAGEGLLAALASGVAALLISWMANRGTKSQVRTAWQAQAEKLRNELRRVYEDQIKYLQGQGEAKDAEIARKAKEIQRLNKLLNKRGADDD